MYSIRLLLSGMGGVNWLLHLNGRVVRFVVIGFFEKISRVHFVSVMQKGIINGGVVSGFRCGEGVVTYLSPLDRSCVVDLLTDRQTDR